MVTSPMGSQKYSNYAASYLARAESVCSGTPRRPSRGFSRRMRPLLRARRNRLQILRCSDTSGPLQATQLKEVFSYETDVPNSGAWNTRGMYSRRSKFRFDAGRSISAITDFGGN